MKEMLLYYIINSHTTFSILNSVTIDTITTPTINTLLQIPSPQT